MTKRTVDITISVRGSAVVDVDHLLKGLRAAGANPWAKHLLSVYDAAGVDALVQAYVKQAYSGGVNNLLRDWAKNGEPESEHGGRVRFAPAKCNASVRDKPTLYPKDVPIGGRYRFLNPRDGLYKGVFVRTGERYSHWDDDSYGFAWHGHEYHPIELVV